MVTVPTPIPPIEYLEPLAWFAGYVVLLVCTVIVASGVKRADRAALGAQGETLGTTQRGDSA